VLPWTILLAVMGMWGAAPEAQHARERVVRLWLQVICPAEMAPLIELAIEIRIMGGQEVVMD
jgi:hypothetical protein